MPYDRSVFITRTPLENVAFDFMVAQDAYIADKLFAPRPVQKSVQKVTQFDTSKLRRVNTKNKTNATAPLVDEQLFTSNITLEEYKVGREINPRDVRDADIPALIEDARAVKQITNHLLLDRELAAATLATTYTNYRSTLTSALSAGSRWNDAQGDPEGDKATADAALISSCGMPANAVAMDYSTYLKLKLSPNFRDRVKYTQLGPVSEDAIKAFFNVQYLFISKARYNTAAEGIADSISSVWSDNVVFFVYNPGVSLEDMSYGIMGLIETPFWTRSFLDEQRNGPAGSMRRVEVGTEYVLAPGFVTSSSSATFAAGYLFRTAVT